jgi:type VI protein secretion system component Hcp
MPMAVDVFSGHPVRSGEPAARLPAARRRCATRCVFQQGLSQGGGRRSDPQLQPERGEHRRDGLGDHRCERRRKVKFSALLVEKVVDRLSPSLFVLSARGFHLPTLQIFVRKAGGAAPQPGRPYLAYEFSTVFVTAVQWSGGGGDEVPAEQVNLVHGGLALGYYAQKPDGSFDTLVKQTWSQITNAPVAGEVLPGF